MSERPTAAPRDRLTIARDATVVATTAPTLPSVRLFAPQSALDFRVNVRLSCGTYPAHGADANVPPYVDGARVPALPWRRPTDEESARLWSEDAPEAHGAVGIVRLLGPAMVQLLEGQKDSIGRCDDATSLKHPLVAVLLDAVRKARVASRAVFSARIGRDQPGLQTTTRAVDRDARIGLHFDRWDNLPVAELGAASNRISLNLGPEDRYFVFLNETASRMSARLEEAGVSARADVREIGMAFMNTFPDHAVVRLRLRPGEAYVAPTENLLHDGTSAEMVGENHYLSLRGHFHFLDAQDH